MSCRIIKRINPTPFELIGLNIEPYSPVDTPELEDEIIVDVEQERCS